MHGVICEDPSGVHKVGEIVEGPNKFNLLKNKGVAILPFDPTLPRDACSAYVQKFFGRGWVFNNGVGERGCQSIFDAREGSQYIYWAAKVGRVSDQAPFSASIRLVHAPQHGRGMGLGMTQLQPVLNVPELTADKTTVVYGKSMFTAGAKGFMFTDLYCVAKGLLVEWLAITQCEVDYQL